MITLDPLVRQLLSQRERDISVIVSYATLDLVNYATLILI
jgi:hypothetical protein